MGGIPETAPYMGIQSNGTAKGEGTDFMAISLSISCL